MPVCLSIVEKFSFSYYVYHILVGHYFIHLSLAHVREGSIKKKKLHIGLYGDFFTLSHCPLTLWLRLFIERFVTGLYHLWIDVLHIYCLIRVIIYRMYLSNYTFAGNIYMLRQEGISKG